MSYADTHIHSFRARLFTPILAIAIAGCGPKPAEDLTPLRAQRVIGAYASWRQQEFPPESLPWSRLTHVGYAFALPKADGTIDMAHARGLAEVVRAARRHGVGVLLAIGGANGSAPFRDIAVSPGLRARFTEETLRLTRKLDLDGVDIDWENWDGGEPDPVGRQGLKVLVADLYARLHPAGKVLTVDVFAGDWLGKHYDAALVDHVDWLNIMAYDGSGSWSRRPGPHSSYGMVRGAVDYWIGKVGQDKRNKLVLFLPFYGKKFPAGFSSGQEVPDMAYRDIVAAHPEAADRNTVKSGGYSVFYDDRRAIHRKIRLANELGLGGVGIWELTQDSNDPASSLISVLAPSR